MKAIIEKIINEINFSIVRKSKNVFYCMLLMSTSNLSSCSSNSYGLLEDKYSQIYLKKDGTEVRNLNRDVHKIQNFYLREISLNSDSLNNYDSLKIFLKN